MRCCALILAFAAVGGCTRFGGADAPASSSSSDAGPEGASPISEAGVASVRDAGGDVTVHDGDLLDGGGTFETPPEGCGADWIPFQGRFELSDMPRTGLHSCKVCLKEGEGSFTINTPRLERSEPGRSYHAEAYLKRLGPHPTKAVVSGRTWDISNNGPEQPYGVKSFPLGSSDAWQLVMLDFETTEYDYPAAYVDVYISFQDPDFGAGETCILVDDFQFRRTN